MKNDTLIILGLIAGVIGIYWWNNNQPVAGAVTNTPVVTVDNQNNGTGMGAYSLPDGSTGDLDPTSGTFG